MKAALFSHSSIHITYQANNIKLLH